MEINIPHLLQSQEPNDINLKLVHYDQAKSASRESRVSVEDSTLAERMSIRSISRTELEEDVIKPIYNQIIHYMESILQGTVADSIEALVLTGGFFNSKSMRELIKSICNAAGVKILSFPDYFLDRNYDYVPVTGAVHKAVDKILPRVDTSKLLLDSMGSIDIRSPTLFVFISRLLVKKR